MSQYTKFTRDIGLIALCNFFTGIQAFILLPIITNNLPVEDYGIWVQIIITIGLIPTIVMLGLPYTMVRYLAHVETVKEKQEGFYSIGIIIISTAGITSFVFIVFSEVISSWLFDNQIVIAYLLSILIFVECINILQFNYFRTFQLMKVYSLFILVRTLIQIFLVSIFILFDFGIIGAIFGLLIANTFLLILMGGYIFSDIGFSFPKFYNVRQFIKFGLPLISGDFSSWIIKSSDRYLIAVFLGTSFVGYYGAGYTIGNIMAIFITPFSFILPAILSKNYDVGNISAVQTILHYSIKYYILVAIPALIGLSLLSKPILEILSTQEIATMGHFIIPFVALSGFITGIHIIQLNSLILEKKTIITGIIWICAAIINFGLNVILIPSIGIVGAAFTTLVAQIFILIAIWYYSNKYIELTFPTKHIFNVILKAVFASIPIITIVQVVNPSGFLHIVVVIIICVISYIIMIFILKILSINEIKFFKALFARDRPLER